SAALRRGEGRSRSPNRHVAQQRELTTTTLPQASARGESMFSRSEYSRAISAEIGEFDQRLRALERRPAAARRRLACGAAQAAGRSAASAAQAADRVGETVASALNGMDERLRGGANSMRDEAAKIGSEAAKLSNDALRRLSDEVEHRPLVTLAVAVGVGILVGLASHRRPHRPSTQRTRPRRR